MRPPVPEVAPPRSRKSSLEQQQWIDPRSATPSTFFLSRNHRDGADSPVEPDNSNDSMYGIQSFDDSISTTSSVAALSPELDSSRSKSASSSAFPTPPQHWSNDVEEESGAAIREPCQNAAFRDAGNALFSRLEPALALSNLTSPRPLTPLNFSNSEDPSSLPSSPKSFTNQSTRHLDDISITDEIVSQAVTSGGEDEDSCPTVNPGSDAMSQLIMPSITIPSRRPFTDKGRSLGRIKVLFAGATGSGKTSLIKSVVQICEDIVHVDLFDEPSRSVSLSQLSRSQNISSRPSHVSSHILEIYASSKPYPTWWSDLEDSRVLRRRKSSGEVVLERNICFVDTPGSRLSQMAQTDAIVQYIGQQLLRATSALDSPNADFQNMLAGNGGSQVDTILYFISHDTLCSDIECISKLGTWTNVIPLIAKADLLTDEQISNLKYAYNEKARAASLRTLHLLGDVSSDLGQPPFAVSSAKSNDDFTMDASTLMSPDYVQPLVVSDLAPLVHSLFNRETMAWLRHSAARKLAQQQREVLSRRQHFLQDSVQCFSSSPFGIAPTYAMARVSDYSRNEEKQARIQLAKWASDLQQSLQNERERYAALARGERAVWLTERLGECVMDGSLVPVTQTPGICGLSAPYNNANARVLMRTQDGENIQYHIATVSPLDPLGVVRWSENLKQRGWALVQIVGSFGIVGGLALWLAKAWGLSSKSFSDWRFDWYCTSD